VGGIVVGWPASSVGGGRDDGVTTRPSKEAPP
jgi:hypothetical protein